MRLATLIWSPVLPNANLSLLELVGLLLVVLRVGQLLWRLSRAAGGVAAAATAQPLAADPLAAAFQRDLRRRGLLPGQSAETG